MPADKIVLGVRFVGTGWQGVGPRYGLYQIDTGAAPGTWDLPGATPSGISATRTSRTTSLPSYTRRWAKEAQVPWLYSADTGIIIVTKIRSR